MGIVLPMSPANTHGYLTVRQVADRAGVTPKTVRRWIESGHLAAVRVGPRLIRIDPADVDALLGRAA